MTEKPDYAIMRIGKIHTRAVLDAVEWHNTRQIPTRTVEGLSLPEEWTEMTGRYRDRADKILKETGATYEETKILAVEVLVTASPEWWTKASDDQKQEWWKAQYAYAKHVFGPGLLAFTPHLDESTPHAQFVGLPLYHAIKKKKGAKPKDPEKLRKRLEEEANAPKIWRLSHDAVFGGGPEGLAERQTEYHGFVAHLGLARGKDTVGLGVKNIPLKHYAKLLTQMDRDLARQADEIAEERQVLEHYDNELSQGFEEIKGHKDLIIKDELRLFAGQEELRLAEERLSASEVSLEQKIKTIEQEEIRTNEAARLLTEREAVLAASIAENEQAKADLQAKVGKHEAKEIFYEHAKADLSEREAAVDAREKAVSAHEARNVKADSEIASKQSDLDRSFAQISVLTGVMSGRLIIAWDGKAEASLADGNLKPNEAKALEAPWPKALQAPLRHALAMASTRKKLADKLRAMLSRLRIKRRNAFAKEMAALKATQDAEKRIRDATISEKAANDAGKRAEQKRTLAEDAQRLADTRIAQAANVDGRINEKQSELTALVADIAAEKQILAEVTDSVKAARATDAALKKTGNDMRAEQASLAAKKQVLSSEILDLEEKKESLSREQAEFDKKRNDLDADRKKWDYSASVWKAAAAQGASVRVKHGRYVIILHGSGNLAEKVIPANEVDQSVVDLVRQKQALEKAMKDVEDLAANFDKQTRLLTERFPDEKKTLEEERGKNKKTMQKVWASMQTDGQGL